MKLELRLAFHQESLIVWGSCLLCLSSLLRTKELQQTKILACRIELHINHNLVVRWCFHSALITPVVT